MGDNMRGNMKSRGKDAYQDLVDIKTEMQAITKLLENTRKLLVEVIDRESRDIDGKVLDGKAQIIGSKIIGIPQRLRFNSSNIEFYIDFTVSPLGRDDEILSKGSVVYGTRRERYGAGKNIPEDKPLIEFLINKHGMIESNGGIECEWWIGGDYREESKTKNKEEKETRKKQLDQVSELHFRALNHIWKEALEWANEIMMP